MEREQLTAEFGKNIGDDVLVEPILSILPPKTLMRFKCISKQWYALINHPWLVAKHLSNSMHNNTRVLLKLKGTNTDQTTQEVFSSQNEFSLLTFCNDNDNDEHSFLANSEDVDIPLLMSLKTRGESLDIIGHCDGIISLAMANNSWELKVLLWNPAIREFKLLPTLPYLPDSSGAYYIFPHDAWRLFKDALGFGYCPKSNDYKVVNILSGTYDYEKSDYIYMYVPPVAAVYTLGTDSWREVKSYDLETETTFLWPARFQMCFKGMCYWLGPEQYKEMDVYDVRDGDIVSEMIILFDLGDEVFHAMMLPDCLYDPLNYAYHVYCYHLRLLVWNESIALFGNNDNVSFGIWVMDEFAWTKHVTFELRDEKPLTFFKSDEILMADINGGLLSYKFSTKNRKYLPIQRVSNDSAVVAHVESIISLLGANKLETRDNSNNVNFSLYKCSPFSYSISDKKSHFLYSVWAIPQDDASLRIKKVMEGLRAEFAGPEIEPHIPVLGSIRMTHDDVLSRFRSLQSHIIYSYKAKVNEVVTRQFYYQCVSLIIDIDQSSKLSEAIRQCSIEFGFYIDIRPRLSLLWGYLTEEERKLAQQKVSIMDENITSLSFPITRLALYKIDSKDKTFKSREKIAEYFLQT